MLLSFISVCFSVQKLSEFFASEEIELDQEPKTPTPTDTNNHSNIKSVVSTCYYHLQFSKECSYVKANTKSELTGLLFVLSQYMLQLQASKLVNRKNKAKQEKNSKIPQQNPNLNMSVVNEENICLKVEIISSNGCWFYSNKC